MLLRVKYFRASCLVIEDGRGLHNYRRISRGWKQYWRTDEHYKEGNSIREFEFHGIKINLALCGDLWDCPENVLMINPVDDHPTHGGSVYFCGGKVAKRLAYDKEDILIVEIDDRLK